MRTHAYDPTTVQNLQVQSEAADWQLDGKITPPQYEAIQKAFSVDFKTANVFTRIGLFVFTVVCCFSILGLIGVLFFDTAEGYEVGSLMMIFGGLIAFLNENLIKSRKWYRFGSDNALLYVAVFCLSVGLVFLTNARSGVTLSLFALIFSGLAAWRYGDPTMAFTAFYALMGCFHQLAYEAQTSALVMGICMALPAFATYLLVKNAQTRPDLFYWKDSFWVVETASLVALYAVLNYFMMEGFKHYDQPNSIVFAATTALLPLIYLFFGIKNKDRLLLILGGLAVAASIATYRFYFELMPIEWAFTLAGLALLLGALGLMQYLKTPKGGFVYDTEKTTKTSLAESLVINQFLGQTPNTPAADDRFSGGDFDGGGSGATF